MLSSSPELSLQTELDILHSYYRSDVLSTAGFERIGASTRFVAMTEGLRARIAMQAGNPDLLRISSAYSVSRVLTHIELGRDPTLMRALSIMLARYLEEYGLRDGITRPLRLSDIVLRIQTSELTVEQQSHLLNILNRFSESEYDGLNPTLIKIGSYLVCVGLFWTFSMGYVFGIARGGYLRRALTTLLVAVALWPLSLLSLIHI